MRLLRSLATLLSFCGLLARPLDAHAQSPAAEALFEQGRVALAAGDLDTACARFRGSDQIDPAAGTRANLGDCEERRGRVASAWEAYRSALAKLAPGDSRVPIVKERIKALEARLPRLLLTLARGAPKETTVREGDVTLGAAATFGVPLPLDPGVHRLMVLAPGRPARTLDVTLVESKTTTLAVEPSSSEGATVTPPALPPGAKPGVPDKVPSPATSRSHAWQPGAVVRVDIDTARAGAVAAPGLSLGLGDYLEINVVALLGKNKGFEPGVAGYFLKGAWKPLLAVGAPIFFIEGARPGVHAAAGIQWDPIRHVGAFVEAGVAAFPGLPIGYQKIMFLPSIGVQARL